MNELLAMLTWIFKNAVAKHSNLDVVLRDAIKAYRERTDTMLRIAQTDPRIAAMIRELDSAGDALDRTVKANQPKETE